MPVDRSRSDSNFYKNALKAEDRRRQLRETNTVMPSIRPSNRANVTAFGTGSGAAHPQQNDKEYQRRIREEIAARQQQERVQDEARRRASKPTDKTMPEGVDELIVGDGVPQYRKIRDVERKLDSVMTRKRLDMQDKYNTDQMPGGSFSSTGGRTKRMKIWISNTVENQPWQGGGMDESAFDFTMGTEASYKVKIQGQLMDDEDLEDIEGGESDDQVVGEKGAGDKQKNSEDAMDTEPDGEDAATKPSTPPQSSRPSQERTKLSHFFKSITVDFDRNKNLQPQGMTQVEWKKPPTQPNMPTLPPAADFDSLEFERKSDENINCTLNFYRDEAPERYLLDKPLSELLDTMEDDRTSIVMGIWEYIKAMGLQQSDEKRYIHCDDRLRAVFGQDNIYFPNISNMIAPHLSPLPPLSVPYTIRVDPDYHSLSDPQRYTIYTLSLRVPSITTPPPGLSPKTIQELKQLQQKDEHIAFLIQAIGKSQRKHKFLMQMAKDPVNFTKKWMASQKRDLEIILGEDGRFEDGNALAGEWSRGGDDGVWGKGEVKEAVGVMVQRPDKDRRAF